jgi:hypothetical protein
MIRAIIWLEVRAEEKIAMPEKHKAMKINPVYDVVTDPRSMLPTGFPRK